AAFTEAFYLPVDDAGIQFAQNAVAETETFDRAGGKVLQEDVGLLREVLDDLEPARRLEIHGEGALVRVVVEEVGIVLVRLGRARAAAGIAARRVRDLDDGGT